jgi:hypothetical protein
LLALSIPIPSKPFPIAEAERGDTERHRIGSNIAYFSEKSVPKFLRERADSFVALLRCSSCGTGVVAQIIPTPEMCLERKNKMMRSMLIGFGYVLCFGCAGFGADEPAFVKTIVSEIARINGDVVSKPERYTFDAQKRTITWLVTAQENLGATTPQGYVVKFLDADGVKMDAGILDTTEFFLLDTTPAVNAQKGDRIRYVFKIPTSIDMKKVKTVSIK